MLFRKILLIILVIFIMIQFIRPDMNRAEGAQPNDISTIHKAPDDVDRILKTVCYDCHSNKTNYPWYFNIQPLAWWLNGHIEEGKEHLNFSEFAAYPLKKQAHKFDEIAEMVQSKEMPLKSYTWAHKEARLTNEERELVVGWAKQMEKQTGIPSAPEKHGEAEGHEDHEH
jgi:hypothetical protein